METKVKEISKTKLIKHKETQVSYDKGIVKRPRLKEKGKKIIKENNMKKNLKLVLGRKIKKSYKK